MFSAVHTCHADFVSGRSLIELCLLRCVCVCTAYCVPGKIHMDFVRLVALLLYYPKYVRIFVRSSTPVGPFCGKLVPS